MAPELCKEIEYDNKVDVWAVGVIAFILMTGTPPFYDRKSTRGGKEQIYADIIKNEPDYSLLSGESLHAQEFIKKALTKDIRKRASVSQLLKMSWITEQVAARSSDK